MTAPSLGGLLATRQGSLLLAVLCSVCAAAVLVFALGRFKSNVAKPIPQATALVATGEIAKGTTGAEIAARGLYKAMPIAESQLSAGAIGNAAALASETASVNILPGQQLTSADFGTISGVDTVLGPGYRGIEISTSEAPGATDIVQAGDHVDIYATGGTEGHGKTSGAPLAAHVLVLKPATAIPVTLGSKIVAGAMLIVSLPVNEVAKVIDENGSLYLALDPSPTGPSQITPYTGNGAR